MAAERRLLAEETPSVSEETSQRTEDGRPQLRGHASEGAPAGAAPAPASRSGASPGGGPKGQRHDARGLRAFLTSSVAALLVLTTILVLEIVYEHVTWPLIPAKYVEIAMILALMFAFGVFALFRWRELVREITERVRAEEAVRKLSSAVEQSPVSVMITDTGGVIEYVNPRFTQVTGYAFEEAVGRNPRILKSGKTPRDLYNQMWRTITAGGEWRGEFRNKRKNGELYWESASISPIRNAEGESTHFLAIAEDITERKSTEAELIRAREQAEAASRAKSEFVANMSHEIRTPMNGVIGPIDLLLDGQLEEEQHDLAETAKLSADALLGIINNILDFSEMEARTLTAELADFSLSSVVQDVVDLFAARAREKGLDLSCSLAPDLPVSVKGDAARVRQVLTNLVDNAIKFTEKGKVTVEAAIVGETSHHASVRISVRDTGLGVPKDRQVAIFESFTQADGSTRRKFGGSGLGLAICRRLVELMGGKLGLESRPGRGSTFRFELTLEKSSPTGEDESRRSGDTLTQPGAAPASDPSPVPVAHEKQAHGLRVLLVEDNPVNRKVSLKLLERGGHRAQAASNGLEALELIAANRFDVVLMDVQMPEMDGFEATAEIRRREMETGGHLPIIAMTAHAMHGDRERCLSHGMDDYISKPVTVETLSATLSTWMPEPHPNGAHNISDAEATASLADLRQIWNLSAGDNEFAEELIGEFLAYTPRLLTELRKAVSRNEAPAVQRLAHGIKGSCRILGAEAMAAACEALGEVIANDRRADAASALKNVEQNYARLRGYLESCLKVRAT